MKGKEINEAEQRFKSLGTETKRVSFPILFWEEFEADCKENFNNTYYLKIMADHEYRKSMQSVTQLIIQDLANLQAEVVDLRAEVEELREQPKQEEKVQEPKAQNKTFG